MKTANLRLAVINSYFELLKNLSTDNKLELIALLSKSMKVVKKQKNGSIDRVFGAFSSDTSADEIIRNIQKSRIFSRKQESF